MPETTAPLYRVLQANRSEFNRRFESARRAYPKLEAPSFLEHLSQTLEPIIRAVDTAYPSATAGVAQVLYDLSLQLVGEEKIGSSARRPGIRKSWSILLPAYVKLVAIAPHDVVRLLTNGTHTLEQFGARADDWIGRMLRAAPAVESVEALASAGQVAAWLSGMAHFREPALELRKTLSGDILSALLGTPVTAEPSDIFDRLAQNRWGSLESHAEQRVGALRASIRHTIGGFRGFGGLFLTPPIVCRDDDAFVVSDSLRSWRITADAFGCTTHGLPERFRGKPVLREISKTGNVTMLESAHALPELHDPSSAAVIGDTAVVTLTASYSVFVVGAV